MQLPSVDDFEEEEDGDQVFHLDRIENQQQQQVNAGIENNTNNETIDEVQVEMENKTNNGTTTVFTPQIPTWDDDNNVNYDENQNEKYYQQHEAGQDYYQEEDNYNQNYYDESYEQPTQEQGDGAEEEEVNKIKEFFDTPLEPQEEPPKEVHKEDTLPSWTCSYCNYINTINAKTSEDNNVCANCYKEKEIIEKNDDDYDKEPKEKAKTGSILERKKQREEMKRMRQNVIKKAVDQLINEGLEEAIHQTILTLKPTKFNEEMERINMEEEDRNWWKNQDFEKRRQERLKEVQEAFGLGVASGDEEGDGMGGINNNNNNHNGEPALTLEEAIAENIRQQELAAKEEHERRERERRKAAKVLKRRKEEFHEDSLNYYDEMNNLENKTLVQRLTSVTRTVKTRMQEAKRNLIGEMNDKSNLTEEQPVKLDVSSIRMLNEMSEALQLLKKLDNFMPCIRDVLVNGFKPKRKPNMKLARERYNKKYFKAKKKWSPDIEAVKRKKEDDNLYNEPYLHIPPRPSQRLTKQQHEQIEKNIAKQIEDLKKDIILRKKRAKKRHEKREKQWTQQRLYGKTFTNDRLKMATERRMKAEKLAETAKRRWDPAKRVSTLFRRLTVNEQDRLIRVALVAAGERCPMSAYDRRDKLEQWLKAVDFKRRDAPNPPRTIIAVEHFIQNLKRSHEIKLLDDTTISDLKNKNKVVTSTGRSILTPAYVSPIKTSPKSSRAKREVLYSVDDSARFRNRKSTAALVHDETWKDDYEEALHQARMVRNRNRDKRVKRIKSPSPIKLAPLPLNAYEGKLNKEVFANEIDRQAKIESLEQVGFLWDETEDDVEDESRVQQADRRRAKSPDTMSPLFRQLQQEEFLKYEQRLAEEEERRLFEKWGEAGPPEEDVYRPPANIMDAIKDPMNMTL